MSVTQALKTYIETEALAGKRIFESNLTRRFGVSHLDIKAVLCLIASEGRIEIDQSHEPVFALRQTAPRPRAIPQRRVATHDGMIWPVPRGQMTDRYQIVTRMAGDCLNLFDERGEISDFDLKRLGWTRYQIDQYGDPAIQAFTRTLHASGRVTIARTAEAA